MVQALLALPAVRAHSEARRAVVGSPRGALDAERAAPGPGRRRLSAHRRASRARPGARSREGAVLISEPLAWRLRLAPA